MNPKPLPDVPKGSKVLLFGIPSQIIRIVTPNIEPYILLYRYLGLFGVLEALHGRQRSEEGSLDVVAKG